MILNMVAGGGSGGLNFSVTSYTSEDLLPTTADENAIAIITDTPISSWTMSRTEPEGVDGMVWISIGDSSRVAFNMLTENTIYIYPLKAYQYINNTWVSKDAKSYQNQNGSLEWVDWVARGTFYDNGDQCISTTGGWTTSGWSYGGCPMNSAVIAETYMQIIGKSEATNDYRNDYASAVGTVNKINVDALEHICADMEITSGGIVNFSLCDGQNTHAAVKNFQKTQVGTYTPSLDVTDLTGDYYIVFSTIAAVGTGLNPSAKITKVWAG